MTTVERMRWWHIDDVAALESVLFPDDRWSIEQFWSELAHDTRRYWIAREGDTIIGYAGLFVLPPDADVQTIAVGDDCQGKGVGRLLLNTMLDSAIQAGAESVLLEVRESNESALALYRAAGFEAIAQRSNYYPNGESAIILQWRPAGEVLND